MEARTRREMAQLLNERMNRSYQALREEQRLPYESSLVKTYVLECHATDSGGHDDVCRVLRDIFEGSGSSFSRRARVEEGHEGGFFAVEADSPKGKALLYVDASDPRFWLVHSMDNSDAVDWIINRLVVFSPKIDRGWFPIQLLEHVAGYGSLRGLGLDYDRREIPDVDFDSRDAPVEFLKMQLWGNRAGRILEILRQQGAFPRETTLAKVKVKYWADGRRDTEDFTIDDVKYDGKITARGTSFYTHSDLVTRLLRTYARSVRTLQEDATIVVRESEGRLAFEGQPVNFTMSRPIANLPIFYESVFNCAAPFRLWAIHIDLSERYIRAAAADLHMSGTLDFEISPSWIRVYLRQGCCANTLLRFYTNLQHYYDSLVEAKLGDGRRLLEL
jgi:hypothetical protein